MESKSFLFFFVAQLVAIQFFSPFPHSPGEAMTLNISLIYGQQVVQKKT